MVMDFLVEAVNANLKQDPNSVLGIQLGKKLMDWVNGVYGIKNAHLRTKKFEQVGLTPEIVDTVFKSKLNFH